MDTKRYLEDDFNEFLKELINNNNLNDLKEEGITKQVIDKGFESLTDKQKWTFEKAISYYTYDECDRCGLEIPWIEMSASEINGGLCSWCQQMESKND